LVRATPSSIATSPVTLSNAKPCSNRSRKSNASRRGSDCRLSTLSRRAAPGSAFQELTGVDRDVDLTVHARIVGRQRRAEPRHLPGQRALAAADRLAGTEPFEQRAAVGNRKLEIHRRAARAPGSPDATAPPQVPVAVSCASGTVTFIFAEAPLAHRLAAGSRRIRFAASISTRPKRAPAQLEVVDDDVEARHRAGRLFVRAGCARPGRRRSSAG
jgi:hypothetical protein